MTAKYFVSYSRSIKAELEPLIDLLCAAGNNVWWDGDIPPIADWWATILDHIETCEIFIFVVSEKSVFSPYCLAELEYALARNRPILPFIIDDSSKYSIPTKLTDTRSQWLIYDTDAAKMLNQVTKASGEIQWNKYRDVPISRPPEPGKGSDSLTKDFHRAVKLAEDGHFDEAIKRFRSISSLDNIEWGNECHEWLLKIEYYREINELLDHKSTLKKANSKWQSYLAKHGDDFDPYDLQTKLSTVSSTPIIVEDIVAKLVSPPEYYLDEVLPDPFEWIEIPDGILEIPILPSASKSKKAKSITIPVFSISKYPITNGQFQVFIDDGGYVNRNYWEEKAWVLREEQPWNKPLGWRTGAKLNHPVVGISWFEANAFCNWLSSKTKSKIDLPSSNEWRYAAQGNNYQIYPWGNSFIKTYANYRLNRYTFGSPKQQNTGTTPVQKYESKSKSPFGVADMIGNVWEWSSIHSLNSNPASSVSTGSSFGQPRAGYVVCGGSYNSWNENELSVHHVELRSPITRSYDLGFRIVKLGNL